MNEQKKQIYVGLLVRDKKAFTQKIVVDAKKIFFEQTGISVRSRFIQNQKGEILGIAFNSTEFLNFFKDIRAAEMAAA